MDAETSCALHAFGSSMTLGGMRLRAFAALRDTITNSGDNCVIPRNNLAAVHIAKLSPSPSGVEGPVPLHGVGVGHKGLRNADRPHPLPLH